MSSNQPLTRPVLSAISDNQMNIHNNIANTDASSFLKQNAHSTSLRAKMGVLNTASAIAAAAATKKKRSLESDEDDANVSPKLKRARLLKLKLQLAYFKVKTNQTETPLNDLKLPNRKSPLPSPMLSNGDSIFDDATTKKQTSKSLKSLKKSTMDDIVTKKGAFANLKRFNQEYNAKNNNSSSVPSSAPPGILSFNHHFTYSTSTSNSHISSVTSPSKFAITSIDKKQIKLPPVPKLLGYPSSNIFHVQQTPSSFNDTTIDERIVEKENNNDTIILQNESTSTPLLRRRHSVDHVERNDPDLTILQSNSILMSTPVRQQKNTKSVKKSLTKSNQKKLTSSTSDFATPSSKTKSTDSKNKSKTNNMILKDDDETQLMSSPTRLLSTPSSIGAAKCLLQLAHR